MKCSERNQSLKQTHQIYFVNTDETCIWHNQYHKKTSYKAIRSFHNS